MVVKDNRILVQDPAKIGPQCNSTVGPWPADDALTKLATQTLFPFPLAARKALPLRSVV
jgi:hypothetical protein